MTGCRRADWSSKQEGLSKIGGKWLLLLSLPVTSSRGSAQLLQDGPPFNMTYHLKCLQEYCVMTDCNFFKLFNILLLIVTHIFMHSNISTNEEILQMVEEKSAERSNTNILKEIKKSRS